MSEPMQELDPSSRSFTTLSSPQDAATTGFSLLPPELIGIIAQCFGRPWRQSLINLCKVNKFFNTACTPVIYTQPIYLYCERALDSFSDTILLHRPELALLVKDVTIDANSTGWDKYGFGWQAMDPLIIARASQTLAACTNTHTLSVLAFEYESFEALCLLFDPLPPLPNLQHLTLRFTLDTNVFRFVQHHYRQLRSLSIVHTHDTVTEVQQATNEGDTWCSQFHLPLPISRITCSPLLLPIFLPGSFITDVLLQWPVCLEQDADSAASATVSTLTQTTFPVTSLHYITRTWNLEFARLAARNLPHLVSLTLQNSEANIYHTFQEEERELLRVNYAGLLDVLNENLPRFDSLKTFRILASTLNELDLGRTCYEDFKLLQKWAQLCPTLSRCDIPSSFSPWVRLPNYNFFVPRFSSDGGGSRGVTGFGYNLFLSELFEKEGTGFAATWFQHYADIRSSTTV